MSTVPQSQALRKMNLPVILVSGGVGGLAGYGADYVAEKARPSLVGTPAAMLADPVYTYNGVTLDWLDVGSYLLGIAGLIAPALLGQKDLSISGPSFAIGKGLRQFGPSYGIQRLI